MRKSTNACHVVVIVAVPKHEKVVNICGAERTGENNHRRLPCRDKADKVRKNSMQEVSRERRPSYAPSRKILEEKVVIRA
jgi:hypothetical protein